MVGLQGNAPLAALFDPISETWTETDAPRSRDGSVTLLDDGSVLFVGGIPYSGSASTADLYHYDRGQSWTTPVGSPSLIPSATTPRPPGFGTAGARRGRLLPDIL